MVRHSHAIEHGGHPALQLDDDFPRAADEVDRVQTVFGMCRVAVPWDEIEIVERTDERLALRVRPTTIRSEDGLVEIASPDQDVTGPASSQLISDNYLCRLTTTTFAGPTAVRTACATVDP